MTDYFSAISAVQSNYNPSCGSAVSENRVAQGESENPPRQMETISQEARVDLQNFYTNATDKIRDIRYPIIFPDLKSKIKGKEIPDSQLSDTTQDSNKSVAWEIPVSQQIDAPYELPPIPPGVNIDKNVREAKEWGTHYDINTASIMFGLHVMPNGEWDYGKSGKYKEFGNFNFGATGRALGYSEETLLRGAGFIGTLTDKRSGTMETHKTVNTG